MIFITAPLWLMIPVWVFFAIGRRAQEKELRLRIEAALAAAAKAAEAEQPPKPDAPAIPATHPRGFPALPALR